MDCYKIHPGAQFSYDNLAINYQYSKHERQLLREQIQQVKQQEILIDQLKQKLEKYENSFGKLEEENNHQIQTLNSQLNCLLYTSPSPRDRQKSRMPSSA
eukprot:TRINITY_DN10851_c0_g1_i2.p2 TRINITY_DN10851_c0_g1~~TRINITY_DN10851_c0_g1_i2.p2  ORF type:complete len:100 (+),score=25.89 TRINITY_DN10851_c0_g1_i2:175-474(+)